MAFVAHTLAHVSECFLGAGAPARCIPWLVALSPICARFFDHSGVPRVDALAIASSAIAFVPQRVPVAERCPHSCASTRMLALMSGTVTLIRCAYVHNSPFRSSPKERRTRALHTPSNEPGIKTVERPGDNRGAGLGAGAPGLHASALDQRNSIRRLE